MYCDTRIKKYISACSLLFLIQRILSAIILHSKIALEIIKLTKKKLASFYTCVMKHSFFFDEEAKTQVFFTSLRIYHCLKFV